MRELEHEFGDSLTVIGVHSAKFPAEEETANLRAAVQRYEISHPVVNDIAQAREELISRAVEVSEIIDVGGGVKYAWFSDPDGNSLTLQEMAWRTGDSF